MTNPGADLVFAFGAARRRELVPRLGTEFLPELNEGAMYVTFTLPVPLRPATSASRARS